MNRDFRQEVSKILVKWYMPTRQVAIIEINALHKAEMVRELKELRSAIKSDDKMYTPYELHLMIDDSIRELEAPMPDNKGEISMWRRR